MAKGLRASSKKRNKSKLREEVFGPVEEARKARLAAKGEELLALALECKESAKADTVMKEGPEGWSRHPRVSQKIVH